jgi:hypothetical protein
MIVFLPIVLLILLVLALTSGLGRKQQAAEFGGIGWSPLRAFTYIMVFAGLLAVLYAMASLLAILIATVTRQSSSLLSADDIRSRVAFALAALLVGLPIWLASWTVAQRRAATSSEEQHAPERRLFLAAVFATTSVTALFALQTLLYVVLTLPGPPVAQPSRLDGIEAGAQLLTYGLAWLAYARLGWRERSARAEDVFHDVAVYLPAGFALSFFATGLYQAVYQIMDQLLGAGQSTLLAEPARSAWIIWGAIASWLLAGGSIWAASQLYDRARGGRRLLRVFYLYVVLAVAVPAALGSGIYGLYEVLRRLFGYHPREGEWIFLRDVLPLLLVAGMVWAYHWLMLRKQAAAEVAVPVPGGIAWPRRPAMALQTLLGLVIAAPAVISLLWLGLDFLFASGAASMGSSWWRDRLSFGLAASMVGTAFWLTGWMRLERAATADPPRERTARARRLLLGTITVVSALTALGFTVALLWLVLRILLGEPHDADTLTHMLRCLSTTVITGALAGYHGVILRRDRQLEPRQPRHSHIVALLAPGAEELLAEFRQRGGRHIEVIGYLAARTHGATEDLQTLQQQLATVGTHAWSEDALLILYPDGGTLYPYTKGAAPPASA